MTIRVLVADDDNAQRFMLEELMKREGYDVVSARDGVEAVAKVREEDFDLAILDIKMPRMDGIQALREIHSIRPHLIVVMVTAYGTTETALQAVKEGAYDYFTKPYNVDELRLVVRRAIEKQRLRQQIFALETQLREKVALDRIVGQSPQMQQVFDLIRKVVSNDVTVLITGESGTGKELVAQAIHFHSARRDFPFLGINCAAIPESLLESELFGHERGAFTGAVSTRKGLFETAQGGTVFLDEIGDMSLPLQSKLLRVLQEKKIMRVGGTTPIPVDVRIIAATNQNLAERVRKKEFREDLYFRLNVIPIHLPPLRERKGDIPLLVHHFIGIYNPRLNRDIHGVTPGAMELLENYPWPGNVRELENVVQRAMILATGNTITEEDLPLNVRSGPIAFPAQAGQLPDDTERILEDFSIPLQEKVNLLTEQLEKKVILAALQRTNFKRQEAADLLGISRKSLHNKMVKYRLFEPDSTEAE